jgi:hypothetical protein
MTTTTLHSTPSNLTWARASVAVIGIWFAAALAFAATGGISIEPGQFPSGLILGVTIPVAVFLTIYNASSSFRRFVLGLDIRTVVAVQQTRVIGALFLALLAAGILPGLFAWPAGAGDVAVGVAAIWVTHRLVRNPASVASGRFLTFHLLGLFDFAVAFATGVLAADPAITGGATTSMMNDLPLAMIPGFLVPLYAIMHLVAIIHWRQARRG